MNRQLSGGPDRLPIGSVGAEPSVDPSPSEAPLIAREAVVKAQGGDLASFEWLVRTYQGEVFRLAYRMLSDRGDAEDIVQEAFVLAWRRLPTLADPEAFHAWICQIATHLCLNLMRLRTRRKTDVTGTGELDTEALSAAHAHVAEGPAARAELSAQVRALTRALASIPDDQRTSWVLKELHDLSYLEIAQAVDAPVSTVRGRIARARRALAAELAQWRQPVPSQRPRPVVVLPFEGRLRESVSAC